MRTTTIALGLMALAALGAAKAKKEASLHDFFAGEAGEQFNRNMRELNGVETETTV